MSALTALTPIPIPPSSRIAFANGVTVALLSTVICLITEGAKSTLPLLTMKLEVLNLAIPFTLLVASTPLTVIIL